MSIVTTYLEMHSPNQLCPTRCADGRFQIREKEERNWRFNRDLYFAVGEMWPWEDKRVWTDEQWKKHGLAPELQTFGAYYDNSLAVITNCAATMRAVSRSLTLVCYRSLLVADSEAHCSPAQSKKHGGCSLQSLVFGCIPARLIIPVPWPIIRPAAWWFTS
jgi:hypothetical protein